MIKSISARAGQSYQSEAAYAYMKIASRKSVVAVINVEVLTLVV